jgi:chaperonin GroEL (HSP60 family)
MDLKRGIDLAVEAIVADLKKNSKKVSSNEEIAQIGKISANGDQFIGEEIAKAMQKVGNEGVITVEEAKSLVTETEIIMKDKRQRSSPASAERDNAGPPYRIEKANLLDALY